MNGSHEFVVGLCDAVGFNYLTYLRLDRNLPRPRGAIAQLGERLHGMQEVGGSIPPGSTKIFNCVPIV